MKRLLTTLTLATGLLLAGTAPALAHNVLVSTDPSNGASLAVAPQQVQLTYNAPVQEGSVTAFNTVTVTGPNGTRWETGTVTVQGNVVTAPLHPLGPAGVYTIAYRIISADGHPVEGTVSFTLTTAGAGTPTAPGTSTAPGAPASSTTAQPATTPARSSQSGGVPVWAWIIGAVALLAIGVTVALRMGRTDENRKD